jgi:hypothetical protein
MMTDEKVSAALEEISLSVRGFEPVRHPDGETGIHFDAAFGRINHGPAWQHVAWMVSECRAMLADGRREKVMRWLGFMQGVLWATGKHTISRLKKMNRPDAPDA